MLRHPDSPVKAQVSTTLCSITAPQFSAALPRIGRIAAPVLDSWGRPQGAGKFIHKRTLLRIELILFGAGTGLGGLLCGGVDSLGIEQLTKH
jgi:hypothetical protein